MADTRIANLSQDYPQKVRAALIRAVIETVQKHAEPTLSLGPHQPTLPFRPPPTDAGLMGPRQPPRLIRRPTTVTFVMPVGWRLLRMQFTQFRVGICCSLEP